MISPVLPWVRTPVPKRGVSVRSQGEATRYREKANQSVTNQRVTNQRVTNQSVTCGQNGIVACGQRCGVRLASAILAKGAAIDEAAVDHAKGRVAGADPKIDRAAGAAVALAEDAARDDLRLRAHVLGVESSSAGVRGASQEGAVSQVD